MEHRIMGFPRRIHRVFIAQPLVFGAYWIFEVSPEYAPDSVYIYLTRRTSEGAFLKYI